MYPHQKDLPPGYWDHALEDRTQQAREGKHFQEYRRPKRNGEEQRDNQNRSIQGWVRPGAQFTCDIHVTNLSAVELGALLWLLSLPPNHYHRFGGGKPLGFGSVRLEIDWEHTRVYAGRQWQQIYGDLEEESPQHRTGDSARDVIQAFQRSVARAYEPAPSFEEVSFIAALLRMAAGFEDGLPVHYPRARQANQTAAVPPHPEGKAYEWFVANERTGRSGGPRASLPDLAHDHGLPTLDAPGGDRGRRGGS